MSRDHQLYLEDILEACTRILRYTQNFTIEQFAANSLVYDAVLRNIEVIGEAAKHIPQDIQQQYPQIDWRRIAGMRDIVAHHYFSIHDEIVWDVVSNKISPLQEQIQQIIQAL